MGSRAGIKARFALDEQLRCYIITGQGVWLYAYAVVFAVDEAMARQEAIALFHERGLMKNTSPADLTVREIPNHGAHLVWDGDY
jgi:hypothetical protein